jgi:hypothetical protein
VQLVAADESIGAGKQEREDIEGFPLQSYPAATAVQLARRQVDLEDSEPSPPRRD